MVPLTALFRRLNRSNDAYPLSQLDEVGFAGPFPLSDISPVDELFRQYDVLRAKPKNRHTDNAQVRALFNDLAVAGAVRSVSAAPFLLWRTHFFAKGMGSKTMGEIGWHHDKHFQNGDRDIDFNEIGAHFSVLIALRDMIKNNGVLEIIPGSHRPMVGLERDSRPYNARTLEDHFLTLPGPIEKKRVQIEIPKGEFLLFHSALLHRSLPYVSGEPRVSLAGRLVRNDIEIPADIATENTCIALSNLS